MDKTAERVHNQTIDFVNKAYEELSTIAHWRKDLRYFNKDYNDVSIDENISNMFILLDDIIILVFKRKQIHYLIIIVEHYFQILKFQK